MSHRDSLNNKEDREMAHHTVLRISSQWNKICQEQTKIKLGALKCMHDQVMCVSGYGLFESGVHMLP